MPRAVHAVTPLPGSADARVRLCSLAQGLCKQPIVLRPGRRAAADESEETSSMGLSGETIDLRAERGPPQRAAAAVS